VNRLFLACQMIEPCWWWRRLLQRRCDFPQGTARGGATQSSLIDGAREGHARRLASEWAGCRPAATLQATGLDRRMVVQYLLDH
jgi:hypothetical protein